MSTFRCLDGLYGMARGLAFHCQARRCKAEKTLISLSLQYACIHALASFGLENAGKASYGMARLAMLLTDHCVPRLGKSLALHSHSLHERIDPFLLIVTNIDAINWKTPQ